MTQLLCTVRDCRCPLDRVERRLVCANGHSFDVARSGYVNLLQPQDSRSRTPGDTPSAVAARRRVADSPHQQPLIEAIVRALPLAEGESLLDAGCGEGSHLAAFRRTHRAHCCGVDISVAAIELAARRYHDCHWIVANADRLIPYADDSFDAVTSITARLNPQEFRRVLEADGRLLVVIPATDDLIELREAVLGEGLERDRVERTVEMFQPLFRLEHHQQIRHRSRLDHAAIEDVLSTSYRGLRTRERERLARLDDVDVTFSRDLLLFR